jgi:hypothetical protein
MGVKTRYDDFTEILQKKIQLKAQIGGPLQGCVKMWFCFSLAPHPVNRFAHKHALADVIVEEPQNQADRAEPVVPGEGKSCDPSDRDMYRN